MESFLVGFWLGVGASVPLGPINVMIMQEALKRYKSAFAIGLGAMSADLSYLTLILIGVVGLIKTQSFSIVVGLFGSLFLLYMAWSIFNSSTESIISDEVEPIDKRDILSYWLRGYLMTLLNPYTLLFWLSLSAYITTKGLEPIYTILGLLTAISIWIIFMPLLIHKSRHLISIKVAKLLSMISAIILLFFAISMAWTIFKTIHTSLPTL